VSARLYRERIYLHYVESASTPLAPDSVAGLAPRMPYLRKLIAEHFPASRDAAILEVGCGHGALQHAAREAGYSRIQGVDGSPSQVAAAHRLGVASVRQGDLTETLQAASPDSLDAIIAFDVIEHLDRDEIIRMADATHRALKPGGRWIVHAPNGASPFAGVVLWGDLTHELAFTTESLTQLTRSTGFSTVRFFEDAPVAHGLKSAVRRLLWKAAVRPFFNLCLVVETGGAQAILTQNLLAVAVK
jgi:SAM-dependent methyltransferase